MDMKNKKTFRKLEAIVIIAVMALSAAVSVIVHGEHDHPVGPNDIVISFSFPQPVITQVLINGTVCDRIIMEGVPMNIGTGFPVLPIKPVSVLLPQRRALESLEIENGTKISLGTGYYVELGQEIVSLGGHGYNWSNHSFNPAIPYPTNLSNTGETQYFRGYGIFIVNLFPVHYIAQTGELYYYPQMTVKIFTNDTGVVNPFFRGQIEDELLLRSKVDDVSKLSTYTSYPSVSSIHSSLVDPSESYDYIIITTQALKNPAWQYAKFQDLAAYKNERGIRTTIVTVEEIYANYSGIDHPEQIRNFIRDAYDFWGINYVLLGGDARYNGNDIVPVRNLAMFLHPPPEFPPDYPDEEIPSDLYYGCLDGSFDSNGNYYWGESNDGTDIPGGSGDVDLLAEVYVGRACVDLPIEVSNFVTKTLAHENSAAPSLQKVLMVGEHLWGPPDYPTDTWGGDYKDEIISGSDQNEYYTTGIPFSYTIDTLYDRDWPNHNWPKSEIIARINAGVQIINHLGHASYTKNMKMYNEDADALTNNQFCFIYSQGCFAGGFDQDDCIAEHFTVKTDHGAFAGIWNARYGWDQAGGTDGPSQRYDRWFFDAIYNASQSNYIVGGLAAANQYSKEKNLYLISENEMMTWDEKICCRIIRWVYYELNLFGDPQTELKPAEIPAHDVRVNNIQTPKYTLPDEQCIIDAYILNKGTSDVTNIPVRLKADGTIVDTVVISQVIQSNTAVVVHLNCSLARGIHEISVEAEPFPDETIINDNILKKTVVSTHPPNQPSTPDGPSIVHKNTPYTYTTSTVDPDGDQVYYLWDWGDETSSDWLGPYVSGLIAGATHEWDETWYYYIKVIARDVHGVLSNWSIPKPIVVSYDIPPCFLAGTKVTMVDGSYKNIEDIKVGDVVKSYDRISQRFSGATVAKIYHHTPEEMGEYYLVFNKDLRVTPNHPLFINGVWTYAENAKIGGHLFSTDGSNILIKSIEKVYKKVPTYNFETALINQFGVIQSGTYFAQGSMVHTQKYINLITNIEQVQMMMSQQGRAGT